MNMNYALFVSNALNFGNNYQMCLLDACTPKFNQQLSIKNMVSYLLTYYADK